MTLLMRTITESYKSCVCAMICKCYSVYKLNIQLRVQHHYIYVGDELVNQKLWKFMKFCQPCWMLSVTPSLSLSLTLLLSIGWQQNVMSYFRWNTKYSSLVRQVIHFKNHKNVRNLSSKYKEAIRFQIKKKQSLELILRLSKTPTTYEESKQISYSSCCVPLVSYQTWNSYEVKQTSSSNGIHAYIGVFNVHCTDVQCTHWSKSIEIYVQSMTNCQFRIGK